MPTPVRRILIVDDDGDHREGLRVLFESLGHETLLAEDGVAAVSKAKCSVPDAIVLDLGLPGEDGLSVLARLKSIVQVAYIPVIVVTARPPYDDEEAALRLGAAVYLQKPVTADELRDALARCLPKAA